MTKHFGIKDTRIQSEIKFHRFRQGRLSVNEYGIRFKQMAATIDFNERALITNFISNLNDDVIEFLRLQDIPDWKM